MRKPGSHSDAHGSGSSISWLLPLSRVLSIHPCVCTNVDVVTIPEAFPGQSADNISIGNQTLLESWIKVLESFFDDLQLQLKFEALSL